MSIQITKEAVTAYLQRIKKCIDEGRYYFVGNRRKNIDSLAKVGLLPRHVKEYIKQLTYKHYFNGPEEERDINHLPGEVMFFGIVFYLKKDGV